VRQRIVRVLTVSLFVGVTVLAIGTGRVYSAGGDGTRKVTPEGFEFPSSTQVLRFNLPRNRYPGTVYKGTWMVENAEEVRPGFVISTAETRPGVAKFVFFTLTMENGGWPPGVYRLDIQVDGKLARSERFTIR
jgi:hypothetical protein